MYHIYQINESEPRKYGKRMRLLSVIISSLLAPIFTLIMVNIYNELDFSIYILIISLIVIYGIIYILYNWFKRKLSSIKRIGVAKFSSNGINVNIGDYTRFLPYKEIRKIRLEKFLYPINISETRNKYSNYILFINHRDKEEKLIIGDKSIKFRKISILKTLEYLSKRKLIQLETNI